MGLNGLWVLGCFWWSVALFFMVNGGRGLDFRWGVWVAHIRASTTDVPNVPNAKYLAHLAHQTQKWSIIKCSKSQKLCHIAIVPSQIWDGTDNNCKIKYYYFIAFFSLLFHRYLSLSLSTLSRFFSTTRHRSRYLMLQTSSPTSTALTAYLQISLNQVVGVRFGMGFDVGFGSAFWIDVV